ncbi:MAG: endonuclease/exonuclease/phosphatase family protein [Caldilineaceae bacterium]
MMRILTYNIHGWRTQAGEPNWAAVADVIAASEADIIGLNEVFYPRILPGMAEPALAALARRLQMHFVFGACLRWPAQDELPADAYGNALLSRWPIIASAAHHLTPKEADQQAMLAEKEQRVLLEARVLRPDTPPLTVYVTHLDHTDEYVRLIQLRAARQWLVRDRNRPHLVMGDFNAISPWDFADRPAAYAQLAAHEKGQNLIVDDKGPQVIAQMEKHGYVDLLRQLGSAGQQSFIPATDMNLRIDYIFASSALAPQATTCLVWQEVPGQEASDHRPVLATFH